MWCLLQGPKVSKLWRFISRLCVQMLAKCLLSHVSAVGTSAAGRAWNCVLLYCLKDVLFCSKNSVSCHFLEGSGFPDLRTGRQFFGIPQRSTTIYELKFQKVLNVRILFPPCSACRILNLHAEESGHERSCPKKKFHIASSTKVWVRKEDKYLAGNLPWTSTRFRGLGFMV